MKLVWALLGLIVQFFKCNVRGFLIAMLSLASCSLGLGGYCLYADLSLKRAQTDTVVKVSSRLLQEARLYAAVPEFQADNKDALLGIADEDFKALFPKAHFIGPKDLALKEDPKIVRVRAQKRKLDEGVYEVRFRSESKFIK